MSTNRGRSPITAPGYGLGRPARNRGMSLPAEILTPAEVFALFESFGTSATEVRNRAMVTLWYRAAVKIGETVALERHHFDPAARKLTLPASAQRAQREIALDAPTYSALVAWLDVRKRLRIRRTAPLFCTITRGQQGNRLGTSYVREYLRDRADGLGIDRRVTAQGIRDSGLEHRKHARGRVESQIGAYLDEDGFSMRYPQAYETLQSAIDLFTVDPVRHATRVGHDCREALNVFADATLAAARVEAAGGTVTKLRAIVAQGRASQGPAVSAHLDALVRYWGTVSDLAQRQEHGALKEGEQLGPEDARRLMFHTMLVMFEVDRTLVQAPAP